MPPRQHIMVGKPAVLQYRAYGQKRVAAVVGSCITRTRQSDTAATGALSAQLPFDELTTMIWKQGAEAVCLPDVREMHSD
jgi:hypothetical protein